MPSDALLEVQQKISALETAREDESEDVMYEQFDLLMDAMTLGDEGRTFAIMGLSAMSQAFNPREMFTLFMERMVAMGTMQDGGLFACMLGPLAQAMGHFTKSQDKFMNNCFPAIFTQLEKFDVKDGTPQMITTDEAEPKDAQPRPQQMKKVPKDYLDFINELLQKYGQGSTMTWPLSAMLMQYSFVLLRAMLCSRAWPQAKEGIAPISDESISQLDSELVDEIAPVVNCIQHCQSSLMFILDYAGSGLKNEEVDRDKDHDSDADSVDQFSDEGLYTPEGLYKDMPEEKEAIQFDLVGVGLYFYFALRNSSPEASPLPGILTPEYVLRLALPFCRALLESGNLMGIWIGMRLLEAASKLVPKYSIRLYEAAGKRPLDEKVEASEEGVPGKDIRTTSELFERYFSFTQQLATIMALTPSQQHRYQCYACLDMFLSNFAERTRHKMVLSFTKLCPYSAVTSLMLLRLKDEVVAEFKVLESELKKDPRDPKECVARFCKTSAFLRPETLKLLEEVLRDYSPKYTDYMDVLMNALNGYRFLILKDVNYNCTGIMNKENQQKLDKEVLTPLKENLQNAQNQSDIQMVMGCSMMWSVVDRIQELIQN